MAEHSARQEREIEVRKKAEAKAEETRKEARQKRHAIQAEKVALHNQKAFEKELDVREKRLAFDKKIVEKEVQEERKRRASESNIRK